MMIFRNFKMLTCQESGEFEKSLNLNGLVKFNCKRSVTHKNNFKLDFFYSQLMMMKFEPDSFKEEDDLNIFFKINIFY